MTPEQHHTLESLKNVVDVTSIGVTVAAVLQAVPHATAVLSLVWVLIRLWETETVRGWFRRRGPQ